MWQAEGKLTSESGPPLRPALPLTGGELCLICLFKSFKKCSLSRDRGAPRDPGLGQMLQKI